MNEKIINLIEHTYSKSSPNMQNSWIIFQGFQDLMIFLAKYFWSLSSSTNSVFSTVFLREQYKQNSLYSPVSPQYRQSVRVLEIA